MQSLLLVSKQNNIWALSLTVESESKRFRSTCLPTLQRSLSSRHRRIISPTGNHLALRIISTLTFRCGCVICTGRYRIIPPINVTRNRPLRNTAWEYDMDVLHRFKPTHHRRTHPRSLQPFTHSLDTSDLWSPRSRATVDSHRYWSFSRSVFASLSP